METYSFDHDRLDAYRLARAAARLMKDVLPYIQRGHAELGDQLKRACLSVCLNVAEGAGTWLPKEKARFYRIARGSATECAAVLDHMVDLGMLTEKDVVTARNTYARLVATLTKLTIAVENTTRDPLPAPAPGHGPVNTPRKR